MLVSAGVKSLFVMRKKELIWIGALLILGGIYIHYFTHWFEKQEIAITASLRPSRRPGETVFPVFFALNGDYKLTSLKVIPLQDNKFDPLAPPVWHLVSDSNSVPTRAFRYGQGIRGMKPALKGVKPDPLTPGTVYRLIVSAGNLSGNKDFQTKTIGD
jgi:hypothetical protein